MVGVFPLNEIEQDGECESQFLNEILSEFLKD